MNEERMQEEADRVGRLMVTFMRENACDPLVFSVACLRVSAELDAMVAIRSGVPVADVYRLRQLLHIRTFTERAQLEQLAMAPPKGSA